MSNVNCPSCNCDIQTGHFNVPITFDGRIVVVKNLPCEHCTRCGQFFVSPAIANELMSMLEADKRKKDVAVIAYKAA
jgi:YgiT-type zinc finger domain-containing protein